MKQHQGSGFSLLELIVTMFIIGIVTMMVVDAIFAQVHKRAILTAARQVRQVLEETQSEARVMSSTTAIRLTRTARSWRYQRFRDGNFNGVLTADIAAGIDESLDGSRELLSQPSVAEVGLPPEGIIDPDGDRLPGGSDPVVFGASRLCSFAPDYRGSPGTIYLTSGGFTAAVRSSGASGAITILLYDRGNGVWTAR